MDHVVYLDAKAKELQNLISGDKTMIIRGATGRKMPHGRVFKGDILYFIENKGDGLVKAKAAVNSVYHSEKLEPDESIAIVDKNQDKLCLDTGLKKRFAGKRYLVLIEITNFSVLEPIRIDRSAYGNMDDWLPVEDIKKVTDNK